MCAVQYYSMRSRSTRMKDLWSGNQCLWPYIFSCIWSPMIGKQIVCKREVSNTQDAYTACISDAWATFFGHNYSPENVSSLYDFLAAIWYTISGCRHFLTDLFSKVGGTLYLGDLAALCTCLSIKTISDKFLIWLFTLESPNHQIKPIVKIFQCMVSWFWKRGCHGDLSVLFVYCRGSFSSVAVTYCLCIEWIGQCLINGAHQKTWVLVCTCLYSTHIS